MCHRYIVKLSLMSSLVLIGSGLASWILIAQPVNEETTYTVSDRESTPVVVFNNIQLGTSTDRKEGLIIKFHQIEVDSRNFPVTFPDIVGYVTVSDKNNQPIQLLPDTNFQVFEDGTEELPITVTPLGSDEAISVALLIDYSGSMTEYKAIFDKEHVANAFVDLLRPGDLVAIIKFASGVYLVEQSFTDNSSLLHSAINGPFPGSEDASTVLYDAIYEGVTACTKVDGRRAVIVITDGWNNAGEYSLDEVIDYAKVRNVSVYTIGLGSSINVTELAWIAEQTHGYYYQAPTLRQLEELYRIISRTPQNQYRISYITHNKGRGGSQRKVLVRVIHQGLTDEDTQVYNVPFCSGTITTNDTTCVEVTNYTSVEVPLVPIVFFDSLSSEVKKEFYHSPENVVRPLLSVIAQRLNANPEISVSLRGFIDPLSELKFYKLSYLRAQAVRKKLLELGVNGSQVGIPHSVCNVAKRRAFSEGWSQAISEENRRVEFEVDKRWDYELFKPQKVYMNRSVSVENSIVFDVMIKSAHDVKDWWVVISDKVGRLIIYLKGNSDTIDNVLIGRTVWDGRDMNGNLIPLNDFYFYKLIFIDNLGRSCSTEADSFYVKAKLIWENVNFLLAEFGTDASPYNFYWNMLDEVVDSLRKHPDWRVHIVGHACAIGDSLHNESLSRVRAVTLRNSLISRLKDAGMETELVDPVEWRGETEPFIVKNTVIGDNATPQGRIFNRRVMIQLYRSSEKANQGKS